MDQRFIVTKSAQRLDLGGSHGRYPMNVGVVAYEQRLFLPMQIACVGPNMNSWG